MQIASNFCQEKHPLANEISGNKASNYKNLQNGNAVSFRDDPKTEKKVVYKIQNYFWFFSAVCICISLEKARETWIHGKITSIQINEGTYASTCCSFRWWCFAARGRASISILFGRTFSHCFSTKSAKSKPQIMSWGQKRKIEWTCNTEASFSQNLTNEEKTQWKNSFEIWNLLCILPQLKGLGHIG